MDIGACFCNEVKWRKKNDGMQAIPRFKQAKYVRKIGIDDIKLEFEPSHRGFIKRKKVLDRYSKESEAYRGMMETIRIDKLRNSGK